MIHLSRCNLGLLQWVWVVRPMFIEFTLTLKHDLSILMCNHLVATEHNWERYAMFHNHCNLRLLCKPGQKHFIVFHLMWLLASTQKGLLWFSCAVIVKCDISFLSSPNLFFSPLVLYDTSGFCTSCSQKLNFVICSTTTKRQNGRSTHEDGVKVFG